MPKLGNTESTFNDFIWQLRKNALMALIWSQTHHLRETIALSGKANALALPKGGSPNYRLDIALRAQQSQQRLGMV